MTFTRAEMAEIEAVDRLAFKIARHAPQTEYEANK